MPLRGDAVALPVCCFYLDRPHFSASYSILSLVPQSQDSLLPNICQLVIPEKVKDVPTMSRSPKSHTPMTPQRNQTLKTLGFSLVSVLPLFLYPPHWMSSSLCDVWTSGLRAGRIFDYWLALLLLLLNDFIFILCNASIKALIVEDLLWSLIDRVCARSLKTEL